MTTNDKTVIAGSHKVNILDKLKGNKFFQLMTNMRPVKPVLTLTNNVKREIVNHTLFEMVKAEDAKTALGKRIQKVKESFSKMTSYKVWYYINRGTPQKERKEFYTNLPSGGKILGYIERNTENIFLCQKTDKEKIVYSFNKGKALLMKVFPSNTTNQEVKSFLMC